MKYLLHTSINTLHGPRFRTLVDIEPVVAGGELLLRVQHWLLVDLRRMPTLAEHEVRVCAHFSMRSSPFAWNQIETAADRLRRHHDLGITFNTPTKCNRCEVEVQTQGFREKPGSSRAAIITTEWMSPGKGMSSQDPKWQRHLQPSENGWQLELTRNHAVIKSIFEDHTGRPQNTAKHEIGRLLAAGYFQRYTTRPIELSERCPPM